MIAAPRTPQRDAMSIGAIGSEFRVQRVCGPLMSFGLLGPVKGQVTSLAEKPAGKRKVLVIGA